MSDNGFARIGIIGLGGFGTFLMKQWNAVPGARIIAASDRNPEKAPKDSPDVRFYGDERNLLNDPEVQIVSIATPPWGHQDLALMAILSGKHVLVQKPLALTSDDCLRIASAAREQGVHASVDFMLRYNPLVEKLKSVIDEGIFGALLRIDIRNYATQDSVPEEHWFWDLQQSGGILIEHGVHFFDLAAWFTGSRPVKITGLSEERRPGMEDRMFAAVVYETGEIGTFWHSFTRPSALERTTMHLGFELGEIDVDGWVPLSCSYWGWADPAKLERLSEILPDPLALVEEMPDRKIEYAGRVHNVSRSVKGRYALAHSKEEVYGACLKSIMRDMIRASLDPSQRMRVSIEDGIAAVVTAERATQAAHGF